jgi:dimeric dUTPase (all-alpha-NTP-PPase superfamily)
MDANAANELLVKPGQNPNAVKAYEERREKVNRMILDAAKNITYDEEDQIILTLQVKLGEYLTKIQQVRDFHQRGDTNGVLVNYREAAEMIDNTLLPAAAKLNEVNRKALDRTYASEQFAAARSLLFVVISSFLLIGLLVAIQLFLSKRMRRTLNPMLLAATAIAVIFLGYTARAFLSASHNLKVAKEDAFESIQDLREGRSIAYSANGDESRYLLDPVFASKHEQAFFNKVAQLVTLPNGQTFQTVAAASAQGQKVEGFTGYMAEELNNITFAGEREAAVDTLSKFGIYLNLDKQIRQLQQSGKQADAIALCVGNNPGQSNWAFEQFKEANQKTLDINQAAFDKAVEQGFKDVDGFEVTTPVVIGAIALLTLLGLRPRLNEYSG